jgi:hypothetical protein
VDDPARRAARLISAFLGCGTFAEVRDRAGDACERLEAVLEAYALISHERHGHRNTELAAFLHRDEQVARAQQPLRDMIRDLLSEGAETGELRGDVEPDELATFCLHALAAASSLPSKAAVHRLVTVTPAGLHPAPDPHGTARFSVRGTRAQRRGPCRGGSSRG